MASLQCRFCGEPVEVSEPIPRDAECVACRRDLRCCVQCRHFDASYNNQCRETQADPVADKERRNFCEFFEFNRSPWGGKRAAVDRAAEARSRLEQMFGSTPSAEARAEAARARLEGLFKKPETPE